MALVIDTGVLFASLNARDRNHGRCRELLEATTEERVVPAPVLVEVDQLLTRIGDLQSWLDLCGEISGGSMNIFQSSARAVGAAAKIQARYRDQPIGFVDAAVFATCETLRESKVATLDHRHFLVLRTESGKALELLP